MALWGHSADTASKVGAHFQTSMGFVPLTFLAIAGSLLQNRELYKEIYESTIYISVLLAKPETHILNKRRSTGKWNLVKRNRHQEKKIPCGPTQLKVCWHFHTSESVLMKKWLTILKTRPQTTQKNGLALSWPSAFLFFPNIRDRVYLAVVVFKLRSLSSRFSSVALATSYVKLPMLPDSQLN